MNFQQIKKFDSCQSTNVKCQTRVLRICYELVGTSLWTFLDVLISLQNPNIRGLAD